VDNYENLIVEVANFCIFRMEEYIIDNWMIIDTSSFIQLPTSAFSAWKSILAVPYDIIDNWMNTQKGKKNEPLPYSQYTLPCGKCPTNSGK
jgi:hypothetical protein